jgi:hypothetical protein
MNKIHKLLFLLLFLPFFLKAIPIHEIQYVPNPTVNESLLHINPEVHHRKSIVSFRILRVHGTEFLYSSDMYQIKEGQQLKWVIALRLQEKL